MKKEFYVAVIGLIASVIFWNLFINNLQDNTTYYDYDLIAYNFKQLALFISAFISSFCLIISLGGLFYENK